MKSKKFSSKKDHLKALYSFRERVRVEILGQTDDEYRTELQHLLSCTNRKIREMEEDSPGTRLI